MKKMILTVAVAMFVGALYAGEGNTNNVGEKAGCTKSKSECPMHKAAAEKAQAEKDAKAAEAAKK